MKQLEYERAVDLYADDVYSIAYGSTRSGEDAEDIVQDVFAKLWQIRNRQEFESEREDNGCDIFSIHLIDIMTDIGGHYA